MTSKIKYFGIRHHGPGSSRRLIESLEREQPKKILIEGPADCSDLVPFLNDAQMQLPVALLGYSTLENKQAIYYPFAEFSPEYQACIWALNNDVPVQFIDLPIAVQLAQMELDSSEATEALNDDLDSEENDSHVEPEKVGEKTIDPFQVLAVQSGYQDTESWWNDVFEQAQSSSHTFELIEKMMGEFREIHEQSHPISLREQQREAHMRIEISKAAKGFDDAIAVIVGAWHTSGLTQKISLKESKDVLKTLPKKLSASKVKKTWIPWTSPRLSFKSGYGAGISSPMWYQHIWRENDESVLETWVVMVARHLRDKGHLVSTASVIEAVRLAKNIAKLRQKSNTGFEELTDAIISCLCFGQSVLWGSIEKEMLLGNAIGAIPDSAPLIPLIEDFQNQQKKCKLKAEALPREVSLDLRTGAGLSKSILLHQMSLLDIPWGKLHDSVNSRGTFREKWDVQWEAEFSIELIENLVYGTSIEMAAQTKCMEKISEESNIGVLSQLVFDCLLANLNDAADFALKRIDYKVTQNDDCLELLQSLPALINVCRYGSARELSNEHIQSLIIRLITQITISLNYSCRDLDNEQAMVYRNAIIEAHQGVLMHELDADIKTMWWHSFEKVYTDSKTNLMVMGAILSLCYQEKNITSQALSVYFNRMLSGNISASDSALFFEGFFSDCINTLLFDDLLLAVLKTWFISLDETQFIEHLPLFRRVFSNLDAMEKKHLMDQIFNKKSQAKQDESIYEDGIEMWQAHFENLSKLLITNN